MNALLVVLFNKGIKLSPPGRRQERLQELKDELGDNLYIAQLTFATAPLLKRCWHRFLPSGAILISW
ncbi:hypothetical protein O5541_01635 [Escherichia coli]|nr:hypothetical protein [Escherichia coli]